MENNRKAKGIGTDIVAIKRIAGCIEKYGDHFLRKIFTESEIALCRNKAHPATCFSGRWAAKEAFFKALPLSCQSVASWKGIEVLCIEGSGKPVVHVRCATLRQSLLKEEISVLHISISHEQDYCIAFALLE